MSEYKDFTQGSILNHIWALSFPTMIAFALQTSFNIVDTIFVGRLGADAIASISIVFPVILLMIALGSGTGTGAASLVARYLGGKKIKEAGSVVEHAILIALFFSFLFGLMGWFFAGPLFILIGATPSVFSLAVDYSKWIFGFGGFLFLFITLSNILRGEGDAKTPMKYMIISVLANIVLDYLLIFGPWFFPALGVEGAAVATVIARGLGCMLLVTHILSGKSLLKIAFKKFRYSFSIIKGIFAVGIPASLSIMLMSIGMMFFIKIVSFFGPGAIAAYGICHKLESIAFLFAIGISISTVALVGHNFGAGKIERSKKIAWTASGFSTLVATFIGLALLTAPGFFLRIFTNDILVLDQAVPFIKILGWFFGFTGFGIVMESAFQGFGRGTPKLILTVLRIGVIGIPLAFILSRIFGLAGVWYGIAISNVINAFLVAVWFKVSRFEKSKNL